MYSKRLYLTKVVKIQRDIPGQGLTDVQVPYLATLPIDPSSADDPYYWDVVYDDHGDPAGSTPGIHLKCIVAVNTEEANHTILEDDPDIIRIDDL